ncbi:hypothetical protein EDD21DRAFT_91964 [Dissophora ornata]|nr:hypothetical protein EDD21DRAFT_91964 [Dissophora ornata]
MSSPRTVPLDRLEYNGNGIAPTRLTATWERSEGSTILSLEKRYISWPDAEQRRVHSERTAEEGFDGCVDFIKGTMNPIFRRPKHDGGFATTGTSSIRLTSRLCTAWIEGLRLPFVGHSASACCLS